MSGLFAYHLISRIPLELMVTRDRTTLFSITDTGQIENIYTLHILNMDKAMHEFEISVSGIEGAEIIGDTLYTVDGGDITTLSLRVRIDPSFLSRPSEPLDFELVATDLPELEAVTESRFMKPL
jgi:polyferredoxin